ncbi:MAG: pyridoxine 5'-phosphate synthase [Pirellulaceae bacterium]
MPELGVNIDHIATLRQARRTYEPDPVRAAVLCELGGADGITVHLREDRRHIQDRDLRLLRDTVAVKLNLEMACTEEMLRIARAIRPDQVTLVPEKREEVTTEGGLDVLGQADSIRRIVDGLGESGIEMSLFIDPALEQVEGSARLGVRAIELHTGTYADSRGSAQRAQLEKLIAAGRAAVESGLRLHAGHGLNYHNVSPVARLEAMHELNIGHAIVSRALYTGLTDAVSEMKRLITA